MIDAKAIGKRIEEARRDRGITSQQGLAEKLIEAAGKQAGKRNFFSTLTRQTVQHWESGKVVPPWDKVELLAVVLAGEYDEEWIMFGSRRGEQLASERPVVAYITPEEAMLIQEYRHADTTGRKSIISNAKAIAKDFPTKAAELHALRASSNVK